MAVDLGISIQPVSGFTLGYYPMLMVGQENWYLGVKGTFGNFEIDNFEPPAENPFYLGTTIVTGVSIGTEPVKLLLELNTMFINGSETPVFFPAGGVYVGLK